MSAPDSKNRAQLTVPKSGYEGRTYDARGALRGQEGHWYRAKKGTHHHRVVKIGEDGRSVGDSYRVRVQDFEELATAPQAAPDNRTEVSVVGQRGTVTIAASLRDRLGIRDGDVMIQEERDGGVWFRPADVVPRDRPTLESLLAKVTPENIHGEIPTGGPVGREVW